MSPGVDHHLGALHQTGEEHHLHAPPPTEHTLNEGGSDQTIADGWRPTLPGRLCGRSLAGELQRTLVSPTSASVSLPTMPGFPRPPCTLLGTRRIVPRPSRRTSSSRWRSGSGPRGSSGSGRSVLALER